MGFGFSQSPNHVHLNKRVKQRRYTFGTHANTAHVWAQQSRETFEGKAGDGRIFFEGASIFSYGRHFTIAKFAGKKCDHQDIVLINSNKYSVSTSSHVGYVHGALRGLGVVLIPVNNPEDGISKDDIEKLFISLAYNEADVTKHANDPDQWRYNYAMGGSNAARLALEAAGIVLGKKVKVPADIGAWNNKRVAALQRAAFERKLDDARKLINTLSVAEIAANVGTLPRNKDTWTYESARNKVLTSLTRLRSARLVVAKAKMPKYVKAASDAIKVLTPLKDKWESALAKARARERLASDLRDIKEAVTFLADPANVGDTRCRPLWNLESAERLVPVAFQRNVTGAELLLQHVQTAHANRETAWREPPYSPRRHVTKQVTPEAWVAGAGDSSQYHITDTLVRRKGDRLQTSRGAEAPWNAAVVAFLKAQQCRKNKTGWERNGEQISVGTYRVDSISPRGNLKAGCHRIEFEEMLRCAVKEMPERVIPTYPLPVVIS